MTDSKQAPLFSSVGILGSGDVAQSLAKGFAQAGYKVWIGSRTPEKLSDFAKQSNVTAGTFEQVAEKAELVVLALKGEVTEQVVKSVAQQLVNKVVVDATNPIRQEDNLKGGVLQYFTPQNGSLMALLQDAVPSAKFIKAWNSVGAPFMINPQFQQGKPSMPICGNDKEAKAKVTQILENFGWQVDDYGGVEVAGPIEALAQLWCARGFNTGKWDGAFALFKMS
jgi:predicted dinucleotide-binding enzyme